MEPVENLPSTGQNPQATLLTCDDGCSGERKQLNGALHIPLMLPFKVKICTNNFEYYEQMSFTCYPVKIHDCNVTYQFLGFLVEGEDSRPTLNQYFTLSISP